MKINVTIAMVLCGALLGADAPEVYRQDFQKLAAGTWPEEEMMSLNGKFAVKEEGDNRYAELPGDPLGSYGFALGPEGATSVSARIRGSNTGRRFPEFGIGLGGAAGYRLWVMPATGQLQIVRNEEVEAKVQFTWKADAWTHLKLRVRADAGKWQVEGKAWLDGQDEPRDWTIRHESTEGIAGRASAWGTPYSSKPIAFDDLVAGK